ncbi:formylglycine-generating enzyme family protein [bacterium]|nr:formylglycine-generating enzyme family protein [bacterium]MBU1983866.1 formylglycine-generating enzyme family protein [bacterium]
MIGRRSLLFLTLIGITGAIHAGGKVRLSIHPLDDYRAEITWEGQSRWWQIERQKEDGAFVALGRFDSSSHSLYDTTLSAGFRFTYRLSGRTLNDEEILIQDSVRTFMDAVRIAGIEPLTGSSALMWWDSLDYAIKKIRVVATKGSQTDARVLTEKNAREGWIVLTDLEIYRDYVLRLDAVSDHSGPVSGAPVRYAHRPPVVEWIFFPAGRFRMGSLLADESPLHKVQVSAFLMSATEVTNREYLRYCDSVRSPYPSDPGFTGKSNYVLQHPTCPVANVSWYDAISYCNWLSRLSGLRPSYEKNGDLRPTNGIRLPTEAEWERSARISGGEFPWGSASPTRQLAVFLSDTAGQKRSFGPASVKSCPPAPAGVYDLAGNVWEWCHDIYGPYAAMDSISVDPQGAAEGPTRVLRGGSWADPADMMRATNRDRMTPTATLATVGFRVVRSVSVTHPTIVNRRIVEKDGLLLP